MPRRYTPSRNAPPETRWKSPSGNTQPANCRHHESARRGSEHYSAARRSQKDGKQTHKQRERRGDHPTTSGTNSTRWRIRNGRLAFRTEVRLLDLRLAPLGFRGEESKRIFRRICTL